MAAVQNAPSGFAMPFPVMSGFTYFFMGPAHYAFGVISGRRRKALERQPAPAAV